MSDTITVAAPPSTQDIAIQLLSTMTALSGVISDFNNGSQILTMSQAIGAVGEQQSIWTNAIAFQALMYGAMSVFGIMPYPAFQAYGVVTFATATASAFASTQNVAIPSGTIVQATGGIQFSTASAVTLASGTSSVSVTGIALIGGVNGNVPAGSINQIVTGLLYPLYVSNPNTFIGGTNPELLSNTLARFAAKVSAIGLSSPIAIANSAIGVLNPATSELVLYSTCYEPWIAAGSGAGSGTAGWTLFIDNGTGTASSGLVNAVISVLNGNIVSGLVGYRDAGVPYSVLPVTGTPAVVGVTGTISALTTTGIVSGLIAAAVSGYFSLPFGAAAQQANLATAIGNSVLGLVTTLSISLYASGGGGSVSSLAVPASGRIVLGALSQTLS